jgi:hypothetical protein
VVRSKGRYFLEDNAGTFWLHRDGRGQVAKILGTEGSHYLNLSIDPESGPCKEKDRSEIMIARQVPMDGRARYLGFRMMLPVHQSPRSQLSQYLMLMQLWQSAPEHSIFSLALSRPSAQSSGFDWAATGRAGPGKKRPRVQTWLASSRQTDLTYPFSKIGADLRPGVWHSFVFRFTISRPSGKVRRGKAQAEPNANVKIWKDGAVFSYAKNLPIGYWAPTNGQLSYSVKLGVYKDCQTKSKVAFDTHRPFALNVDDVRFGGSFDAVAPW